MASILLGPAIANIRGSIGGTVFSRNRGGAYIKARVTPINPNSSRQVVVRAAMAFLTSRWSDTLTAGQRTAWNLYASSVTMLNRLGQAVNHSGFNHYIRSNMLLKLALATLVDDGPVDFTIPAQDPTFAITGTEAAQTLSYAYDAGMDWADENDAYLHVFEGSPQNPQINFFNGPYRRGGSLPGVNGAPPASPLVLATSWGIAEGQHLFVYARIQRADGRLSEPFEADTFCAA